MSSLAVQPNRMNLAPQKQVNSVGPMDYSRLKQHIEMKLFYQNKWLQPFFDGCEKRTARSLKSLKLPDYAYQHTDRRTPKLQIKPKLVKTFGKKKRLSTLENNKNHYTALVPFYFTGSQQDISAVIEYTKQIKQDALKGVSDQERGRFQLVLLLNHPRITLASKSQSNQNNELNALAVKLQPHLKGLPFQVHLYYAMWQPKYGREKINLYDPGEEAIGTATRHPPLHYFSAMVDAAASSKDELCLEVQQQFEKLYLKNITSVVPYSQLRQAIYETDVVQERKNKLNRKVHYFISLDNDSSSLAYEDKGLISQLDQALESKKADLVSLGYGFDEASPYLSKLACKIDMLVRKHTAAEGLGVYFPEPSFAFSAQLSVDYTSGGLHSLENRHMIQNLEMEREGTKRKLTRLFLNWATVTTKQAQRMHPSEQNNPTPFRRKILTEKTSMAKLRSLSQSHYFGRNFAENVYVHLPSEYKCSEAMKMQKAIQGLFSAYDINNRIYSAQARGKTANEILSEINHQIKYNSVKTDQRRTKKSFLKHCAEMNPTKRLGVEEKGILNAQGETLIENRQTLKTMGLPSSLISRIERACCNAHNAIGKLLLEEFAL